MWPAQPREGQLVRLPLPCPPMLLDALGCESSLRYVVLWWGGGRAGEPFWWDGVATGAANADAWSALTRHNLLCRVLFDAYDLADDYVAPDWDPSHRLVVDRWNGTLDVALAADVAVLLAAQPRGGHGPMAELERRVQAAFETDAAPEAAPPTGDQMAVLCAWLDMALEWVDTGWGPAPGDERCAPAAGAPASP